MILGLLLLLSLTSTVSAGAFVVNVTQTSHQAEEDHNITLEWTFTPRADGSLRDLNIFCELLIKDRDSVLFDLHEGVEVPESQDGQFKGRVQCDKDALREGRLRLHVSRLRIEDSGLYVCKVFTNYGRNSGKCRLNVTAARVLPKPLRPIPTSRPQPESPGTIVLYCLSAAAAAAAVLLGLFFLFSHLKKTLSRRQETCYYSQPIEQGSCSNISAGEGTLIKSNELGESNITLTSILNDTE